MSAELISKWAHVLAAASHIPTWDSADDLAYIAECASKAQWGIESGVYMGASSFVMCMANPEFHLWSVDPFMVFGTEQVSRYFLKQFIDRGQCEIIPKRVEHAASMLQHMKGQIDLVFVDDGHAEEDVDYDIRHLLPLMEHNGVMIGHDFEDNPLNGVARSVIKNLPGYTVPSPRIWQFIIGTPAPGKSSKCCGAK